MTEVRESVVRISVALLFGTQVLLTSVQAAEQGEPRTIKVYRVGSSSFGYQLIEMTRRLVEVSGNYRLVCDSKQDSSGYTRLEWWPKRPGLYEEWRQKTIPDIKAGRYDYVIVQTIGWLGLTPEQQNRLCTEMIPDMAERVRATGARVIFYDKYLRPLRGQEDPRARTWCGRYPEGYRLNYLLHIMAAKNAGIEKISFGGVAVTELWDIPGFGDLRFLLHDGHPGPYADYISAVNLAYLLTGEDPVDNPVRELPIWPGRFRTFEQLADSERPGERRLYEEREARMKKNAMILTDTEARILKETAMKSQRKWGGLLRENLESDQAFAATMKEIRRIQGDMLDCEKYGVDEETAQGLRAQYAAPEEPDELPPALIKKLSRKSKRAFTVSTLRNRVSELLPPDEIKKVRNEITRYWDKNNNKLRDDIYLEGTLFEAKLMKAGKRDELESVRATLIMIRYVLSLPGWRILIEHLDEDQARLVLGEYDVHGVTKRNSRAFAAYQNEHHTDKQKLYKAWDIYLDIFSDPDRLDRLRDNNYRIEVFHEADKEFAWRIEALDPDGS